MSLRALWVLAPHSDDWTIVFERRFRSVEQHAKRLLKDAYVEIPLDKRILAKLIIDRLGLSKSAKEKFHDDRDSCRKRSSIPAIRLTVSDKILYPVVVVVHANHLLCGIPLIDEEIDVESSFELPSVSTTYDLLLGMQQWLGPLPNGPEPKLYHELHKYVAKVMPFGRPAETNASTVRQAMQGKPVAIPKGERVHSQKSYVNSKTRPTVSTVEMVRAAIYNKAHVEDSVDVYGTISWRGDAETGAIKLNVCFQKTAVDFVSVHPCVTDLDRDSNNTIKLRFSPISNSIPLCSYTVNVEQDFPLHGSFELNCSTALAGFLVRLRMGEGVERSFDRLEVRVSFPQTFVVPVDVAHRTCGEVSDADRQRQLVWTIGQKFPNRSDVSLKGSVRFARSITKTAAATFQAKAYATVSFHVADYTFSGLDVDAKSAQPTSKKLAATCEKEFRSSDYVLWNTCGEPPTGFRELKNSNVENILRQNTD